ncbi:hypothetical protein BJV82DRAFT_515886 [Fennellomyces sp. T-0311]|nr:hypothetical protein BJV82DRAFT_515886 [Fennellomyces sp. T-0311]
MDVANRPLPMNFLQTKSRKAPIVWIARNCAATSGRQNYVEQLMKYVEVDSYGDCLNNQKFPEDKSRMELMGEYKFYLAIENANCEDYVTEKLFDTFAASTVPIVDGPDSYEGFIPDRKSVIRMDAFPDPRDLANYINYLDQNDDAYLEHLAFRKHALDVSANDRLDASFIGNWSDPAFHNIRSSWCSVCRGMLPWWKARVDPHAQPPAKDKSKLLVDKSCWERGKWDYAAEGPPYQPDWKPSPNPITLQPKVPISQLSPKRHSDMWTPRVIWTTEVVLGFLFMVFVAFMMNRQRRRPAKHDLSMSA